MVNSPWKGFLRKKRSKTARSSTRPAFQYAYAIVIWYRSEMRGGERNNRINDLKWDEIQIDCSVVDIVNMGHVICQDSGVLSGQCHLHNSRIQARD